jgi:DNA-binding transcriptional LysR family regulator
VESVELRDLRLALVTSQHRSLRRGAEALRIRQSTLSRRLRDLEYRLGAIYSSARTGGLVLPLQDARHILEDTEMALRNLRSRSRGENGKLTIEVYASLATGNMHATLADYHRRFPEIDVHTVDGSHSRLISALGRNAVDVAIMTNYRSGWDDRALSLWTERVIVALTLSPAPRLAGGAQRTLGSAEVDGKPDSRLVFRCPRDPMEAVGRDQHVVARTEITLTTPVNP